MLLRETHYYNNSSILVAAEGGQGSLGDNGNGSPENHEGIQLQEL